MSQDLSRHESFFFPFALQMVVSFQNVSYVVESLFCLSLVTESGERSMGSNLVTESGTPRTITCRKSKIVSVLMVSCWYVSNRKNLQFALGLMIKMC